MNKISKKYITIISSIKLIIIVGSKLFEISLYGVVVVVVVSVDVKNAAVVPSSYSSLS